MTSRRVFAIHLILGNRGADSAQVFEVEPPAGSSRVRAWLLPGGLASTPLADRLAPLAEEEVAEYLLLPDEERLAWRWARAEEAEAALARGEWRPRWWEAAQSARARGISPP